MTTDPPTHHAPPSQAGPARRTFVSFRLAGEEHAIPVEKVLEVLACPRTTRVPTTPEWILGIMHLRGGVVPVLDLAAKLGLGMTPIAPTTCVVLLDSDALGERRTVGLLVESAERLLEVEPEAVEPPPSFGTKIAVDYLTGLVRVGEGYVLLLEVDKALSIEELGQLHRAGDPAAIPPEEPVP